MDRYSHPKSPKGEVIEPEQDQDRPELTYSYQTDPNSDIELDSDRESSEDEKSEPEQDQDRPELTSFYQFDPNSYMELDSNRESSEDEKSEPEQDQDRPELTFLIKSEPDSDMDRHLVTRLSRFDESAIKNIEVKAELTVSLKEEEGSLMAYADKWQPNKEPIGIFDDLNTHLLDNYGGHLKVSQENHWSNPGTQLYDTLRMLESDDCLAPDPLLRRPTADFSYITDEGELVDAPQYDWISNQDKQKEATATEEGTTMKKSVLYYNPRKRVFVRKPCGGEPYTSEVRVTELCNMCLVMVRLTEIESQEEAFNARPSIHLPIPDHIKAMLVDDWENVTKNQQLVPLPAEHSVESILNDYLEVEGAKRQAGTHQSDLLLEVIQGLKEYFDKCLGRILLYRFERQQYLEVRDGWNAPGGDLAGKTALTTYGAEHFCRLLVSLPELLAQTNMDQQSCNRLCEEITKLTIWLGRNVETYFRSEYETPGPAYVEKARNG